MAQVLVIDDDPDLLSVCRVGLQALGHVVRTAETGHDGLAEAAIARPGVIVLDLGLPDMDGVDVIGGLRGWTKVPIIVLSGRADSADKVEALDAGADDYVTKPFGMDELLARMRAAVRRTPAAELPPRLALGDLTVDLTAKRVTRAGPGGTRVRSGENGAAADADPHPDGDIRLTPTEWHLLEVLLRNPGKLLSHRQLLNEVWGPGYDNAGGNLRLYMAQLRRKLEPDPARPRWLITEPGMGYRYQPPDQGQGHADDQAPDQTGELARDPDGSALEK